MQENEHLTDFKSDHLCSKTDITKNASESSPEFREPFSLSGHTTFRKLKDMGRCYESFLYQDLILPQKTMEIAWEIMQVSRLLRVIHTLMGYREKWQRIESITFTAQSTALSFCVVQLKPGHMSFLKSH